MVRLFQKSSTRTASIILAAATFLSYFLGIFRDKSLAFFFGASTLTDAYNASFLLPDFIFNLLIAGTFTGVLIPTIVEYKEKGEKEAEELVNIFLTVMSTVIVLTSLFALIFTKELIGFFIDTRSASPEMIETTIHLTRFMLLSPLLFGISNTLGAVLMAHHHFTSYALSPALYNVGIILGTWILSPYIGIYGATFGTLVGMILHLAVRYFDLFHFHFHFRPRWSPFHKGFLTLIKKSIPRTLGLLTVVYVLSLYSFTGSSLGSGSYASSIFARNIQCFLINMFGVSLATAILPRLSEYVVTKAHAAFGNLMEKTILQLLYVTLPAVPVFLFFGYNIVSILLGGGAFHEEAIKTTSILLFLFSLSIPFECLTHIYARAFYAMQKISVPTISFFLFGSMVTLVLLTTKSIYGIYSLPLSWICGSVVQQLFLMGIFHFWERQLSFSALSFFPRFLKIIFLTIVCGASTWLITQLELQLYPAIALGLLFWGTLFVTLSFLLKIDEFEILRQIVMNKIKR